MKSLAIICVLSGTALAQEAASDVSYRVKQGDTVELIAAEFYGDHAHTATFIVEENKLKPPYKVYPGERIKVPVTREVATAKDDRFDKLATEYLGDAKRAPFLAEVNHMQPDDPLATGTVITIPFHFSYTAPAAESFGQISTELFGDAKQADAIRAYNGLDKAGVDKGETVVVPVLHVRTRPEHTPTLDADSAQRHETQKRAIADAAAALPLAQTAWLEGDFKRVRALLGPSKKQFDYLDNATAVDVGVLLGKADVAFDDKDGATELFHDVLARSSGTTLSAYSESPKVLEVWRAAGGSVK
ncbi:MAG TPA: LysM peptidoglycan-binding domain-containing protein [Kofleriaceae bacterium]